MTSSCSRCRKRIGVTEMFSFNRATERCSDCDREVQTVMTQFRQQLNQYFSGGNLTIQEIYSLRDITNWNSIAWDEALQMVATDSARYLNQLVTFAAADGVITPEEEDGILQAKELLNVPDNHARPILDRLERLKITSNIKRGQLPSVTTSIHLDSGELCHLDTYATYQKMTARGVNQIQGNLVATTKKIHFLSPTGGWTIQYKNIMRVSSNYGGIHIELSTKQGNGYYGIPDSELAAAIIETATKISKRQLVVTSDGPSRHIPHDVKTAVWQRDGGKCVQCGATDYLEFDHIIPFSQGGASTVNNVQVLCRRCNLAKSNRI